MLHNMKKHDYQCPAPVDKKKQYRVLITTDLEVDDMNGINKSQGLLVKTFGEGEYGFYFTPECNE